MNIVVSEEFRAAVRSHAEEAAKELRSALGVEGRPQTDDAVSATLGKWVTLVSEEFSASCHSLVEQEARENTRRIVLEVFDRFMEGRS